ncbi:MAG: hypothetical protein KKF48_05165 [Nanoarchaeota archaeon]|nr:hypothetical protein [Nanoarchaeota archaeon]MBU1028408.1 hypothetical protein [Nanoarchaeota archaeon]
MNREKLEKERREYLWNMIGNAPKAAFEVGLFGGIVGSIGLGTLSSTIGAGSAYLLGYEQVAEKMLYGGLMGVCGGVLATIFTGMMYSMTFVGPPGEQDSTYEFGIDKFTENYRKFRNCKRENNLEKTLENEEN